MYRLENPLRTYPWGSTTAIARLLGREPTGDPEAELWLGAHPGSPSVAVLPDGTTLALDELIAANPEPMLGAAARSAYGDRLPFLAKLLAAASPLSLQVHPSTEQARDGYAREEAAGIPRDAANRNYKDDSSKPEMIFALSDFDALCGFRSPEGAAAVLTEILVAFKNAEAEAPPLLGELIELLQGPQPESERLRRSFERLIAGGEDVCALVTAAADAVAGGVAAVSPDAVARVNAAADTAPGAAAEPSAASRPAVYVRELRTLVELHRAFPGDPGVLISVLLNRVSLQAGEALYLPAGNIHAYLGGLGVEVMASSDNVLRGGLTTKHVDVPELVKTVDFTALALPEQQAEYTGLDQELYRPPFSEFQLQRIEIPEDSAGMATADIPVEQNGPCIILVVRGAMVLDSPRGALRLDTGQSAFIPANEAPVMAKIVSDADSGPFGAVAFAVTISTRTG